VLRHWRSNSRKALAGRALDHGIVPPRSQAGERHAPAPPVRVKILDFRTRHRPGHVPERRAPHQRRRDPRDAGVHVAGTDSPGRHRRPIRSLSRWEIVLFELLTGTHPFGTGDGATLLARILERPPADFDRDVAGDRASGQMRRGLEVVIRTLLQKTPSSRFASAHQLLAALQRVRAGGVTVPLAAGTDDDAATARRWWRFHQMAACAFYVAVLVPAFFARRTLGQQMGRPLFLLAIVAVVGAVTLRLHFWFTAGSLPGEWPGSTPARGSGCASPTSCSSPPSRRSA
jgi:hypothetical protein